MQRQSCKTFTDLSIGAQTVEDVAFDLKFWAKLTTQLKNANFESIFARSVSAVTPSEKSSTRKRAIAKALHLEGHSDFAPVDVAYYQHFLFFFLFQNIAFLKFRLASTNADLLT